MSDDDSPDNVRQLPRIGFPPPPPVPPPPALDGDGAAPDSEPDTVRISPFDAPRVPHAPQSASSVPAALRSDGLDGAAPDPHALPPRAGALSLAAILAIALAAFEGLHTWIQESGPRRAEAAAHQRELELLAAKANADATRHSAEADREHARARRVPSSHDYGRSALGRGSGGTGRSGGGIGSGRPGTGRTGPSSGSTQHRSAGFGSGRAGGMGRSVTGRHGSGPAGSGTGPGRNGGSPGRNGAAGNRPGAGGGRSGGASDRSSSGWGRNGAGPSRNGGAGSRNGPGGSSGGPRGAGGLGGGSGGSGRRSPRQAVADWWSKGRKSHAGSTAVPGSKAPAGGAGTKTAPGARVKGGPTLWDDLKNRVGGGCFKNGRIGGKPNTGVKAPRMPTGADASKGPSGAGTRGPAGRGSSGERVHLKDALFERVNDRWKKRRDGWKDNVGQRGRRTKPSRNASERRGRQRPRTGAPGASGDDARRSGSGPNGSGHAGYGQARTSPFDQAGGDPVTFTVEQVDPPGTHAKRWEPAEIGQAPRGLPGQGQPALPWAPQRPAGKRPGTSRRKDPIPMPQTPARRGSAAVSAGVHATDITLDDALEALTKLVSDGMTTSDDADQLARQSNRLVAAVESINQDLAAAHNVKGKTTRAMETVMEGVTEVVRVAQRLAKKAHDAAEAAEAEENKMKRDYRPVQAATADAGLATPSARIHNEN